MVNPVALFLLSEIRVFTLHLLDHRDKEVFCGVPRVVKMGSYWFLEPLVADIAAVSVEVNMKRVFCLPHVSRDYFLPNSPVTE